MLKNPATLRKEGKKEAYEYFDKKIRPLPKNKNGSINTKSPELNNNDVDAFRHAYTSGIIILEYKNELIADVLGILNEIVRPNNPEDEKNMDLWNNSIGRKYGKIAKSKEELAKLLHNALKNGELITTQSDARKYGGKTSFNFDPVKPIIVLEEKETGRNETFLDLVTGEIMDRETFTAQIQSGVYSGYTVADINEIATPMSKPDGTSANNLG